MTLLLCALAGFVLAQLAKAFSPGGKRLPGWLKLVIALIGSGLVAAVFYRHRPYDLAVYAFAGLGLAAILHKTARFLSIRGDREVTEINRNHQDARQRTNSPRGF